jgi:ketosteroid isomerase-like protein
MTEQDNTQLVESIFDAFGRGDIPFIMGRLSDDVRFVAHLEPVVPWSGDYAGKAKVAEYFHALGGSVEVGAHPVNQLVAHGDTVVAMGDVSFRVRSTGKAGDSSWIYVWTLRDGQVERYEQFNDTGLADAFR